MPTHYIDTPDQLAHWSAELSRHSLIGIDTEFKRRETYFAKLCLLQVQTENDTLLIDPLGTLQEQDLRAFLLESPCRFVIHSGRQDLEILFRQGDAIAERIFDTQVAAALLGYGGSIGYARLVNAMLQEDLAKAETLTDWTQRPLSQRQLNYAAEDVIHLLPLYQTLSEALKQKERLHILIQEQQRLYNDNTLFAVPSQPWNRIHAIRKLRGARLGIAQHLAVWREAKARTDDKPKSRILSDQDLISVAQRAPESLEQLTHCLPKLKNLGLQQEILSKVEEGRWIKPQKMNFKKPQNATTGINKSDLRPLLEDYAQSSGIDITLLLPKGELDKFVSGDADCLLTQGWRQGLLADLLAPPGDAAAVGPVVP